MNKDRLIAEIATVTDLLDEARKIEDPIGELSFINRLAQLEDELDTVAVKSNN